MIADTYCKDCKQSKPSDLFSECYKGKEKGYCRECRQKKYEASKSVATSRERPTVLPESKLCAVCKTIKPQDMFPKRAASKDGLARLCKQCSSEKDKEYYQNNREAILANVKEYTANNKDKINERLRSYRKRREKSDPKYRIDRRFSCAVYQDLVLRGTSKSNRGWQEIVGYTVDELRAHLERLFKPDMNWENYGTYWHIDHVRPKEWFDYASYEDPEFKRCWSLDNLQPLEAIANVTKSNRYEG